MAKDERIELSRTGAGLPRRPSRASSQRAPLQLAPMRARRDSKREALLQAAREEFAANGFHGAHVAVVAARAGIRKSTFFHYYEDKEALYDAAVAALLDEIAGAVDDVVAANTAYVSKLDALIEVLHDRLALEAPLPRLLLRGLVDAPPDGAARPTAVERIVARLVDIIGAGEREGALPTHDATSSACALLAVIALSRTSTAKLIELQERARGLLGVR